MKDCIIWDIDLTLADNRHRAHFVENCNPDWDAFFNACYKDTPIKQMVDMYNAYYGHTDLSMVLVTGRPNRISNQTLMWLYDVARIDYHHLLLMRDDGDYRKDYECKADLIDKLRAVEYNPVLAFEDNDRVIRMLREKNIPTIKVDINLLDNKE